MHSNVTPIAVIADGYSSANFLPGAFRRHGFEVVHVHGSTALRPSMIPPDLSQYADNIFCSERPPISTKRSNALRATSRSRLTGEPIREHGSL